MSSDETFVLMLSAAIAVAGWLAWYIRPQGVERLGAPLGGQSAVYVAPPLAFLLLFGVLVTLASHDVRDDPQYILMYFSLGAAWLWVGAKFLPLFGLSPRDDVFERGNRAAGFAVSGALLGIMLCYAGGNIGDGPGWWVVVFAAAIASWALLLSWAVLERVTAISDVVTIDRDVAAGIRLGGFLVACGLIFGRAVAGNWVSGAATLRDFALNGWPALGLLAIAILIERTSRPTPSSPTPSPITHGVLPAVLYVAIAAVHALRYALAE